MKAVTLSLLCHLLFIQVFVLTFAARPAARKPLFVFLGSILEGHDFISIGPNRKKLQTKLAHRENRLVVVSRASGFQQSMSDPKEETSVIKPTFPGNVRKGTKRFLKATFLETETPVVDPAEENWAVELGIRLTVPARRPFRWHQR